MRLCPGEESERSSGKGLDTLEKNSPGLPAPIVHNRSADPRPRVPRCFEGGINVTRLLGSTHVLFCAPRRDPRLPFGNSDPEGFRRRQFRCLRRLRDQGLRHSSHGDGTTFVADTVGTVRNADNVKLVDVVLSDSVFSAAQLTVVRDTNGDGLVSAGEPAFNNLASAQGTGVLSGLPIGPLSDDASCELCLLHSE